MDGVWNHRRAYRTREDDCSLESGSRSLESLVSSRSRRCTVLDLVFVVSTIALFVVLALAVKGAEKL
jgi:hypothetical protein